MKNRTSSPSKGLYWGITAAIVGGFAVALTYVKASRSPSGKAWPAGVTNDRENKAVAWALVHETDLGKLRDFARSIEGYDKNAAQKLNERALLLQVKTTNSASTADPAFRRLNSIATAIRTPAFKRTP